MTKICSHCKEELPIEQFSKNKSQKDGIHNQCKKCGNESAKITYRKYHPIKEKEKLPDGFKKCATCKELLSINKFPIKNTSKDGLGYQCFCCTAEYNKTRRMKTRNSPGTKTCNICKIEFCSDNFSKCSSSKDGLFYNCKDCLKIKSASYRAKLKKRGYHMCWSEQTIYHHTKNGYIINFTKQQLNEIAKSVKYCEFCNKELSWVASGKTNDSSPSLENRELKNVLDIEDISIICHMCNRTKSNRTMEEFVDYCKMISDKFS